MVNIGEISFIIIIQSIITLAMLVAFLIFLLVKKNARIKALLPGAKDSKGEPAQASVEHYLTAEIKLTAGRFDLLYKEEDLLTESFTEADWLKLREHFLATEKEFLANSERDGFFWSFLGEKLKNLLKNNRLVKRIKVKEAEEDDDDDVKEMKALLKSQHDDFDELTSILEGEHSDIEMAELKAKVMKIASSHTELSQCVFVLEDENQFLRDQIASLLKDH